MDKRRTIQLGLEAGFGELNSLGFGFINPITEGKMLHAIKKLGDYVIEKENMNEEEPLIQKSKLMNSKMILSAVFELKDGDLTYYRVNIEPDPFYKADKILYRTFTHGRYDVTPTTRVLSIEQLEKRILLWFKEVAKKYDHPLIKSLHREIEDKSDKIFEDLSKRYNELSKEDKRGVIFTIKIKEGERDKYFSDFEIFREIFKKEASEKFFIKHKVESKGKGTCHICCQETEVLGFASPFSFSTFDKPGFVSSFDRKNSWKSLPICVKCAVSLEAGKGYLDRKLLKRFDGFKFYVIPNFVFGEVNEEVMDEIESSDKRKYVDSILCAEDDILDILKEEEKVMNLIFIFIKPKQKDFFDIIKYVEDVPPSWIKRLSDALKEVRDLKIFRDETVLKKIFGEKKTGGLDSKITIGSLLRPFFPKPDYDKSFIDLVGGILAQKKIDKNFLINAFVREIRNRHVNKKHWEEKTLCLKSFMLLKFLNKLNLIKE